MERLGGKCSPEPRALAATLGLRAQVDTLFRAAAAEDALFRSLILAPLDLTAAVAGLAPPSTRRSDLWWKCILCLPNLEEGSEFYSMARYAWLEVSGQIRGWVDVHQSSHNKLNPIKCVTGDLALELNSPGEIAKLKQNPISPSGC